MKTYKEEEICKFQYLNLKTKANISTVSSCVAQTRWEMTVLTGKATVSKVSTKRN